MAFILLVFLQLSVLTAKIVAFFYDFIVIQKSSSRDAKFTFCGLGYYYVETETFWNINEREKYVWKFVLRNVCVGDDCTMC